jgi:hypothetical protein
VRRTCVDGGGVMLAICVGGEVDSLSSSFWLDIDPIRAAGGVVGAGKLSIMLFSRCDMAATQN